MKKNILRLVAMGVLCCCAVAIIHNNDAFATTYHVGDSVTISDVTEYSYCSRSGGCTTTTFDIGFYADGIWKNPDCYCQNPGYDLTTSEDFKYFFRSASGTVESVSNGSAKVSVYINMGKKSLGYGYNMQDMACTIYLNSEPEDYYDDDSDTYSYTGTEVQSTEEFKIEGSSEVTDVTNVEESTVKAGVYEINSATEGATVSFNHEMWQSPSSIFDVSITHWGPSYRNAIIENDSVTEVAGSKTSNPSLAKNDNLTNVCQKISFRSKTWTYDIVRDTKTTVITEYHNHYDGDGNLLSDSTVTTSSNTEYTSKPYIDENSISGSGDSGSSEEACAYLHRPWNFKVDSITNLKTDEIAYTGETLTQSFSIDIIKNNSTYPITDIPNATISLCYGIKGKESCEALYSNRTISGASGEINSSSSYSAYNKEGYTISGITKTISVPDVNAGTEYCVWLTMSPSDSGNGYYSNINKNAASSAKTCYTIAKKPLFHVYGNNVYVSGNAVTKTSNKTIGGVTRFYGPWVELGLTVNGGNNALASGASLAGINGGNSNAFCANYNPLTVTNNSNCRNKSGVVKDDSRRAGLVEQFRTESNTYYTDQTLNSSPSGDGVNLVAVEGANITISGNLINRNKTISGVSDIPMLILYAENIYIDCGVGQIDAILIAESEINTCYNPNAESGDAKNASNRSNQLIINGAIVADTLRLERTYGAAAGNNSNVPAEIVNMSTGIYLLGKQKNTYDSTLDTAYLRELAPRY